MRKIERRIILTKILFVCHGNICRSPMAEFVFKEMTKGRNDVYIASAATSNEEIGNGVHYGTANLLRKKGISTAGKTAVRMTREDYDEYDYIIGMDGWNIRNINRICGGDPDKKVYKLLDFTDRGGDIADPWYTHDFETTYKDVFEGCEGLLSEIDGRK